MRFWRPMIAMILLGALLLPVSGAKAQDELLAGPITSWDFTQYLKRIRVSHDQWVALEAMHEEYKTRWSEFAETDLVRVREMLSEMEGQAMPTQESLERFLRARRLGTQRIADFDERLFVQMLETLDGGQINRLNIVRRQREQAHYAFPVMQMGMGGGDANITSIIDSLGLDEETLDQIEPLISEHETRRATTMRQMQDAFFEMATDMIGRMEASGLNEEEMWQNPEFMEMQQRFMMSMMEGQQRIQEMNQRTTELLRGRLPEEHREVMRIYALSQTHPNAYPDREVLYPHYRRLLNDESLDAATRDALRAHLDRYRREHDQMTQQIVEAVQRQQEAQMSMGAEWDSDRWQEIMDLMNRAMTARSQHHRAAMQELPRIVGEERFNRVNQSVMQDRQRMQERLAGDQLVQPVRPSMGMRLDQFLPAQVTREEIEQYLARLGVDSDRRRLAMSFFEDYRSAWEAAFTQEDRTRLQQAQTAVWQSEGDRMAAYETLKRIRGEFFERIVAMEDELMLDLEAILSAEELPHFSAVRTARNATRYTGMNQFFNSSVGEVSLAMMLHSAGLEHAEWRSVAKTLEAHEERMLELRQRGWEAQQEVDQANVRVQILYSSGQPVAANAYQEIVGNPSRVLGEITTELSNQITGTLATLLRELPPARATVVQQRFDQISYPQHFPDRLTPERAFAAAERLSLTNEQRSQIERARSEHAQRHEEINIQLREALGNSIRSPYMNMEPETAREWQRAQQAIQRLTHERYELNVTALRAIRAAVSADQAAELADAIAIRRPPVESWRAQAQVDLEMIRELVPPA